MIAAVVVGLVVVVAVAIAAGLRAYHALQARVAVLESRTDAAQRWQDEVRKAIGAAH